MALISKAGSLTLANILIPVSLLIFATGFFPYKPFLPGLAQHPELRYGAPSAAPFDRVIFMVVDALRSDFVFDEPSGFTFTQGLITKGLALPFTAHAQAPTVTMPRVKALTTGSIPSFLDMILNFAESDTTSTLANQDTWLAQIKARDSGKLVMYGDDTWLKLFPDTFERADGTSSFFVSDFTEVDNNVTRHIPTELNNDDWTAMIVHYLAADARASGYMIPKQKEMDGIVEQIYDAIIRKPHLHNTLLVLCGDHGMNDGGNHGGSSPGETSPALVLVSPLLHRITKGVACPTHPKRDLEYYTVVEQSDIAASVAGLLGLPTSRNNLGVFIPELLALWPEDRDQVFVLLRNAIQILEIVRSAFPSIDFDSSTRNVDCSQSPSSGDELWCAWRDVSAKLALQQETVPSLNEIGETLRKFCRLSQQSLSSTASNYDLSRMISGIVLASISSLLALVSIVTGSGSLKSVSGGVFLASILLYTLVLFASSFVEEEQQFWFWLSSAWLQLQAFRRGSRGWAIAIPLLIFQRVIRRWNQSGQKFQGSPDIANTFLPLTPSLLWFAVSATYIQLLVSIYKDSVRPLGLSRSFSAAISGFIVGASFLFKLSFTQNDAPELVSLKGLPQDLVGLARVYFVPSLLLAAYILWTNRRQSKPTARLEPLFRSFLITQAKAVNVPLHLFIDAQQRGLNKLDLSTLSSFVGTFLLAQTSFFAFGNTNSISSVDLSQAYNGLTSFSLVLVGTLLTFSTFGGPLAHLVGRSGAQTQQVVSQPPASTSSTPTRERGSGAGHSAAGARAGSWRRTVELGTAWTALGVVGVEVACFWLREHLFVWTVFSPKYLYVAAWWAAWHLLGVIGIGWLLA